MNTLSLWEPVREGVTLRDAMSRLFEDSFVRPDALGRTMPMDVLESQDGYTIKVSLPGCTKEQLELNFEKNTLSIKAYVGDKTEEPKTEVVGKNRYLLRERFSGQLSRSLTLPVNIDVEKANAQFRDGVLTLTLPKAESVKPRTIKVTE